MEDWHDGMMAQKTIYPSGQAKWWQGLWMCPGEHSSSGWVSPSSHRYRNRYRTRTDRGRPDTDGDPRRATRDGRPDDE
ncbi:hypothetical protein JXA88_08810 [Candidatus Fermentibacteria bacterium]|nr:hypothetical protein [Candidatus Fermentibacteria bacterium]